LKSRKLDKKAVFHDWLPLVVSILVLVLMFFFMFFGRVISEANVNKALAETVSKLDADVIFLNYLNTPVKVWDRQANIADLIVWSINNREYAELEQKTEQILSGNDISWSITIYDGNKYFRAARAYEKGKLYSFSNYVAKIGLTERAILLRSGQILPVIGNDQLTSAYVEFRVVKK